MGSNLSGVSVLHGFKILSIISTVPFLPGRGCQVFISKLPRASLCKAGFSGACRRLFVVSFTRLVPSMR